MNRKLLIVDKDPRTLRSFDRLFTRVGFNVESTRYVSDAYELLKKNHFDCVIMSLTPANHVGGHDLLVYTKKVTPKTTAVITSEFPQINKAMNLIAYGADAVFAKPVAINLLIKAVVDNIPPN